MFFIHIWRIKRKPPKIEKSTMILSKYHHFAGFVFVLSFCGQVRERYYVCYGSEWKLPFRVWKEEFDKWRLSPENPTVAWCQSLPIPFWAGMAEVHQSDALISDAKMWLYLLRDQAQASLRTASCHQSSKPCLNGTTFRGDSKPTINNNEPSVHQH